MWNERATVRIQHTREDLARSVCHQTDRVEVGEDKNISGSSRRCNVIIGGVDDSGAGGTREKPFPRLKFGAKPSKLPPEKYLPHKSHPWIVDSGCLDCISLPEWTAVDSLGQSPDNPQTLHHTPPPPTSVVCTRGQTKDYADLAK